MASTGTRRLTTGRRILLVLGGLILLVVLLVACLPMLLDTAAVRRLVAGRIGGLLDRTVILGGIDVGWRSGIEITDLAVLDPSGEFGGGALLEVASVRADGSLLQLILRGDPGEIAIDGLKLNVRSHAGGRSNLDDLIERIAPRPRPRAPTEPRPPGPPPERPPPFPLHLRIRSASLEITHLPYQPPARPLDPFAEDVPVLPADAGSIRGGVEDLDLSLDIEDGRTVARLEGRAGLQGRMGRLSGEVTLEPGGEARVRVALDGVDLAPLAALLPVELRGVIDLELMGRTDAAGNADLSLRTSLEGFHLSGPERGSIDEERLALEVDARITATELEVTRLDLVSSSGEFSLRRTGELRVPLDGDVTGLALHFDSAAPLRLVALATGGEPTEGALRIRLDSEESGGRIEAALLGELTGPTTLRCEADLVVSPGEESIELTRLELGEGRSNLKVTGSVQGKPLPRATLEAGGTLDLAEILEDLRPLLRIDDDSRIAGLARIEDLRVTLEETGDLHLRTEIDISGFAVSGDDKRPLRKADRRIVLDASLLERGDVLDLRPSRIDDLELEARVEGLRGRGVRRAVGSVSGRLDLTVLSPYLLGMAGFENLEGTLEADAQAVTDEQGVSVVATLRLHDLDFETDDYHFPKRSLSIETELHAIDGVWQGSAEVKADIVHASVTDIHVPPGGPARLQGGAETTDLRTLLGLIPGLVIPPELEIGGEAAAENATVVIRDGWSADTGLRSDSLTLKIDGVGIQDEPFTALAHARTNGDRWDFHDTTLRLPGRAIEFAARSAAVNEDDSWFAEGRLRGPLAQMSRFAPQIAGLQLRGLVDVFARVDSNGTFDIASKGDVTRFAMQLGDKEVAGPLQLDVACAIEDEGVRFDRIDLKLGGSSWQAIGRVGERLVFEVGAVGQLTDLLLPSPLFTGNGLGHFKVLLDAPNGGDGELRVFGDVFAERLREPGVELDRVDGRIEITARVVDGLLRNTVQSFKGTSTELRIEGVRFVEVELDQQITGDQLGAQPGKGWQFKAAVDVKTIDLGGLPLHGVTIECDGRFRGTREEPDIYAKGELFFDGIDLDFLHPRNGKASAELRNNVLHVSDLAVDTSGGRTRGEAWLTLNLDPVAWETRLKMTGIELTEELHDPLSFIVPILRLGKRSSEDREDEQDDEGSLSGSMGADFNLRGLGFSRKTLQKSLNGGGEITFHEVSVAGSFLLPLLQLRPDQLLTGKPYTFRNSRAVFRAKNGVITTEAFKLKSEIAGMEMKGTAGLDGTLDFLIRSTIWRVPFRISGDWDNVSVTATPLGWGR